MSGESRNPEERRASSPAARAITPARPLRIERISDRADLPRADLTPRHSVHPSLHDTLLLNYATNANLSLPSTHFRVFLLACWLKQTTPHAHRYACSVMPHPAAILLTLTPSEQRDFLPKPLLEAVRSLATLFEYLDPTNLTPAEFQRALAERNPEILIACWGTPPLPAKLPSNLRYVSYLAGSIKHLLTREHITNGLQVTNWGHSISRTVAEMALLHILAGLRRTTHWTLVMHQANGWKNNESEAGSLFGRRVGIHGFGPVARELLKLLQPFGCTVAVHAPDVDATTATRYGISATTTLADLFADNEIIVELAPLIPATTGIVTEKILRLIRPGGIFVNVGRGAVVDEAALLRVATEGKIAIGLDVFSQEPLPADSGFRRLSNVALTPHMAGPTNDRKCDAGAFALSNLRAYAADHPLQAVITPSIYDASS